MSISSCCLKGFEWDGKPTGRIGKIANNDTYIAGDNPDVVILLIHDLLSWNFPNLRLLADHYARETGATVYLPDFFGGDSLPFGPILSNQWHLLDVPAFIAKNTRQIREPEIFEVARALREKYQKIGAVGFCFGGWAVFRLGAKEYQPPLVPPLVDCISAGHPTWLNKKDIDEVAVPVQICAPENDAVFTDELKLYSFQTILKLGIPFDYQHFPSVEHACFSRGDMDHLGEREAMIRGKNAAVSWFKQFLFETE